jgi:DNA-directed RNA polymerase subunit A'
MISGKDIFSYLLPKGLNLEFKSKMGEKVVIRDGKLLQGVIDMKAVGREAGKLIDIIEKEFGTEVVHKFIDRVTLLGIKYLDMTGFTVGPSDFDISPAVSEKIATAIARGEATVGSLIERAARGDVIIVPGRTAQESLEAHILEALSHTSEELGRIIDGAFPDNAPIRMARSGSRGSMTHITQLAAAVGQARVLGERIHRGYRGRTLSHFAVGDLSTAAHGFISSSFKSGLNPFEFFFDNVSGRESLMDKSLRTRHSGYLERRLMNALQDLKIEYDGTVRDNRKIVVQFVPGEDWIDPAKSDWGILDVRAIAQSVLPKTG